MTATVENRPARKKRAWMTPPALAKDEGLCTYGDCNAELYMAGLCVTHYWRNREQDDSKMGAVVRRRLDLDLIEDLEWVAGTDTPDSIAHRFGYADFDSLRTSLRKHASNHKDRTDRIERLIAAVYERHEIETKFQTYYGTAG